jgi:hypothetical protein
MRGGFIPFIDFFSLTKISVPSKLMGRRMCYGLLLVLMLTRQQPE